MFLDKLRETEQVLFRYKNWQESVKSGDKLLDTLDSIKGSLQGLSLQLEASTEAKKELVPKAGMNSEQRESFYSQLNQLREDLDDGIDASEDSKSLRISVKAFIDDENRKWKEAVEAKANTQILLLQELGRFTEDPAAASTVVMRLKANVVQMPKDAQKISDYAKVLINAQSMVKKVGGTPAVMDFIHKLNQGRAVLSDLDDEIWAWIRDKNMENKIKISL